MSTGADRAQPRRACDRASVASKLRPPAGPSFIVLAVYGFSDPWRPNKGAFRSGANKNASTG
eukprot:15443879-Alexandrium_andersonii.AAC.1